MKGLAPHSELIFERIAALECIKPFVLVGGTALSLQIGTRMSEDLDFMKWRTHKDEKMDVDWPTIKRELETIGTIDAMNLMDFDHVQFVLNGVKISFYAASRFAPPMKATPLLHNLRVADIRAIGVMKMEVMLRRANFRDYYDIYSILQAGENLQEMIQLALLHSGHLLKSKQLLAILTNGNRFTRDSQFEQMAPIYQVSPIDIENYIKDVLKDKPSFGEG